MAFSISDLNSLDLSNLGDFPKPVKVIIIVIVCVVIVAGLFWFVNQPQLDTLSIAQQKEVDLKNDFETKQAKAANLEAYKKQLVEMKKSFGALLHRLPSRTEVPGLLEDISSAAVTSGLKINSFKPQPEKEFDFYAELPIEITATGDYHKFANFVSKLASLDRIVTVHDFTINEAKATADKPAAVPKTTDPQALIDNANAKKVDSLAIKIVVQTYRYKEDSGIAPAKGGGAKGAAAKKGAPVKKQPAKGAK